MDAAGSAGRDGAGRGRVGRFAPFNGGGVSGTAETDASDDEVMKMF